MSINRGFKSTLPGSLFIIYYITLVARSRLALGVFNSACRENEKKYLFYCNLPAS